MTATTAKTTTHTGYTTYTSNGARTAPAAPTTHTSAATAAAAATTSSVRTPSLDRLTARELEIARRVRDGRTTRQIARVLGLSTKTVEAHLSRIFAKLAIPSRTVLAVLVTSGERTAA
jgi:DNA-binding CsgD family transcriptional regulator